MQIIIAPARNMKSDPDSLPIQGLPQFLPQTKQILAHMRSLSYDQLHHLWWNCSEKIAIPNYHWVQQMDLYHQLTPALLAFTGLQYQRMAPGVCDEQSLEYVQDHLRILSGFYGLLKPFDGIVPYRLGMGDRAQVEGTKNLYEFWGSCLADELYSQDKLVLNLASQEYAKVIVPYVKGNRQFVSCTFVKAENGRFKTQATRAKIARGNMVRYLAEHQANDLAVVKDFNLGYHFDEQASTPDKLIFVED